MVMNLGINIDIDIHISMSIKYISPVSIPIGIDTGEIYFIALLRLLIPAFCSGPLSSSFSCCVWH